VAVMEDATTFLLRLPQQLKQQLEQRAKEENRSVNSLLVTLIEQSLQAKQSTSLENRQFLGKVVENRQIDPENGLAQVNGIYYRYLIEGNEKFSAKKKYIVIEANGNILTLRPVVK
jgi:hypothetical protein